MRLRSTLLFVLLLFLYHVKLTSTARPIVYQKDLSEHCRRRVVPSVFLGTHVAESHSKILHFSKMELPYSCFVSVRGELASNLILVTQLTSESNLVNACGYYPNQLLVYEMGETFGGYWGPLPETLMKPSSTVKRKYVRRGTSAESSQRHLQESTPKSTTVTIETPPIHTETEMDFIQVEIPLVEVKAEMGTGDDNRSAVFRIEDDFDMMFDVTPGKHQKYETSEIPILEFSVAQSMNGRRLGDETLFEVEYDDDSPTTPDVEQAVLLKNDKLPHISLQTSTKKKSSIRRTYETIRSHTKQKPLFTVTRKSKINSKLQLDKNKMNPAEENMWENIEEILKGLKKSYIHNNTNIDESENITKILETLSNQNHNYSLYLQPDWKSISIHGTNAKDSINKLMFGITTRKMFPTLAARNIHQLKPTMFYNFTNNFVTKPLDFNISTINVVKDFTQVTTKQSKQKVEENFTNSISNISMDDNILIETTFKGFEDTPVDNNVTITSVLTQNPTEDVTTNTLLEATKPKLTSLSGTMVDHESWENVVQAAPVMAVHLSSTAITKDNVMNTSLQNNTKGRNKRRIIPIPIENARPRELTTKEVTLTTESHHYYVSDVQDLAQLVELQDDELHDRVGLRYFRQYVGPIIFNICDFNEPKARHIFLFNSSRIVLAISNFTLERLSVVLTPARTLFSGNSKCSDYRLECQVSGARVCIDKTNACDGIPNCGSFDIYDEDRLMCGAAVGLQHTVFLAAITFIAVLLTMLYTVHYWLRRCVPRVSKAFFIYTDRAENTLYLETIMRSPHDVADNNNLYHEPVFTTDDTMYEKITKQGQQSIGYKMWRCCFACITCKCLQKRKTDLKLEIGQKTTYSFTEIELNKISTSEGVDVTVQTGDSLEIGNTEKKAMTKKQQPQYQTVIEMSSTSNTDSHMELQILKRMKENKIECKEHCKCSDLSDETSLVEKEIYIQELNTVATPTEIKPPTPPTMQTTPQVYSPKPESSKRVVKHLRFDETPVTIPTSDIEEEVLMQGVLAGDDSIHKKNNDAEKAEEESGTTSEFKRFWNSRKMKKKSRKKTNLTLHYN